MAPASGASAASGSSGLSGSAGASSGAAVSPTSAKSSNSSTAAADSSSGAPGKPSGQATPAVRSQTNPNPTSQPQLNTSQAPSGSATTGATSGATPQQGKTTGPSFIETLAQSQADANVTAAPAPEEVTGGKSKTQSDDSKTASAASLAFISQALAAGVAGIQTPAQKPATAAAAQNVSADAVSLTSGPSVQSIVAKLTEATVDGLKAASDGTGTLKTDTPVAHGPGADGGSQAVSAFQAHMSVSSHLQPTASADPAASKMSAPVGTAAFNDELGGKITWMAHQGVQSASLQLSPEHLGPVGVRIAVQDGSATVSFNASHPDTRAALEQALPRLRDMFATQGLTLSDASVSQQSPRGQPQKQTITAIGAVGNVSDEPTSALASVAGIRPGLVDTYA